MNLSDLQIPQEHEAKLRYEGGDFQILENGSYVCCAVTGQRIALDDLEYWSISRQEAYASALISYDRELSCHPELRKDL